MKLVPNLPILLLSMIPDSVKAAGNVDTPSQFNSTTPGISGGSDPAGSITVDLTGIANTTKANAVNYSTAMTAAFKNQMPDFVKAVTATAQDCDENCCEEACIALIWIPLAMLICVEECLAAHGDQPPIQGGGISGPNLHKLISFVAHVFHDLCFGVTGKA